MSEPLFILIKGLKDPVVPVVRGVTHQGQLLGYRIVGLDFTQKDHPLFPAALKRLKAQHAVDIKIQGQDDEKPFSNPDRTQDQINQINRQIAIDNGWQRKFSEAKQEWRWYSPNGGDNYLAPPDYYNNDPRYCEQRLAQMVALGFRFEPPAMKVEQHTVGDVTVSGQITKPDVADVRDLGEEDLNRLYK